VLEKLKDLGIENNTIVVFTSDHGGMKLEHGAMNKGLPYETSAGIPFIVKYPDHVRPGKVIETVYSSVDFAPTILSMMGISKLPNSLNFQGVDGSLELFNPELLTSNDEHITFSFDTGKSPVWAFATKKGYKLVISRHDIPWLFDLKRDPDELVNYATSPWHKPIFEELRDALVEAMPKFEVPIVKLGIPIYLDVPSCIDSRDALPLNNRKKLFFCTDIGKSLPIERCNTTRYVFRQRCPVACKQCCQDSPGMMWLKNKVRTCNTLRGSLCKSKKVRQFCPETCNAC